MSDEQGVVAKEQPPAEGEITVQVTAVTAQPTGEVEEKIVFGEVPVWITDDKGNRVQTELRYKNGLFAWVCVLALFALLAGLFLCCFAVIPLFMKSFKDIEHINPNTGVVVGRLDRARSYGLRT